MKPILLIHGYSSEGAGKKVEDIYGNLPSELRTIFGADNVKELNLSRWISLNDGICLDDVSFAMDRALKAKYPTLLQSGFHVIIHSTGALVARNWIKKFSPKPSPIVNLIHLAGANFGSGLAHIGQGQLARWGRFLTIGTGCGYRILNELEFGSWKTLDLHLYFLKDGTKMFEDYEVQEHCIIGSQIPKLLRVVPIRYVREDSSDCTVRTSAGNLNFNYVAIRPTEAAHALSYKKLAQLVEDRREGTRIPSNYYKIGKQHLTEDTSHRKIPYSIPYEIAHSGDEIGIVTGEEHREPLLGLIKTALETPFDEQAYAETARVFAEAKDQVFEKIGSRKGFKGWNLHRQYEGHAQLIFRIRDQDGLPVEHFDVNMDSVAARGTKMAFPDLIKSSHCNKKDQGTITFYLRTQNYQNGDVPWEELLHQVVSLDLEVTGEERLSDDIAYVPLNVRLTGRQLQAMMKTFQTTVVDITLLRLPSSKVFAITPAP